MQGTGLVRWGWFALWWGLHAPALLAHKADEKGGLPTYRAAEVFVTGTRFSLPGIGTTATKMPLELHATPASLGVVPGALVESQGGVVLGDALKNISGVNVQTGFGVHDFFVIRGFDSLSSGLVLRDGAVEPEVSFYNMYNIERVEVLKGPGAFLYGGNPLSGTVNLVRKQPLFQNFSHFSTSLGRFQSYRSALDAGWADAAAGVALRLNALWREAENYRDDKDSHVLAFNPSLSWKLSAKTELHFNLEYTGSEYKSDSGLPVIAAAPSSPPRFEVLAPVPRTRSYQSPFDASEQDIFRVRLDIESRISPALTLRDKFYYTHFDWNSIGTLLNGTFPGEQGGLDVFRTLLALDDRQRFAGNQFEALLRFETGAVGHQLLAGVEVARLGDTFTLEVNALPPIDVFAPVETAAAPLSPLEGASTAARARTLVAAPYFVDRIAFGHRVHLFVGGRFDLLDYDDRLSATARNDEQFSPMLGLLYAPGGQWSFYLNGGGAFAPPSSRVMGKRRPEKSAQFELGVKKSFLGGRARASAAWYHLEKNDIAIPDAGGVLREVGDQRARGVEVAVAAQPGKEWYFSGSYAFSAAELTRFSERVARPGAAGVRFQTVDRSGKDPAFAPRHLLNMWAQKGFAGGFDAGVGARYVGRQFIAADNVFAIDAVLTFDAMLSYRLAHWRWRLNLENFTDRNYDTRGFGAHSVIPAPPIGVYGVLEWML